MTPIAAYYVMIVTENEREQRRTQLDAAAPQPSRLDRIVAALETLVRLGRPATTQPI